MKLLRSTITTLALAGGITATVMTGTAFGAAPAMGTNCHGAYLSYLASSGIAPGQLHHDFGASVQDVQATADAVCQL